jgi:hypothetical protein
VAIRAAANLARMRTRALGGIHFVEAVKDGVVGSWTAATIQVNAVAAGEKQIGCGWISTLTEQRLTGRRRLGDGTR